MFKHLRELNYYENRYDNGTIEQCRSGEHIVNGAFKELEKKVPKKELTEKMLGWYLQYSQYYFFLVESVAAARYEARDQTIAKWMKEDEAKDDRLASAHVSGGTYCRACVKDMHVISKDYMHREGRKDDDVLFMFECDDCNKRLALWEDGSEWEGAKHECENCGAKTTRKHTKKADVITWTETCTKCKHVKTDTIDLSDTTSPTESVDPYLELDRKRFLFDKDTMFKYEQKMKHFVRMAELHAKAEDKVEHVDVFDGIKEVKKLKIVQLKELLEPVFTKNGYSDFKLGDPKIAREVSLDFSCLDTKDDREEYQSKKVLHKAIEKALIDTNWRLMSAGLNYRLGFLTGSLRAHESEEEIRKLVEQRMKDGYVPTPTPKTPDESDAKPKAKFYELDMRESALVYFDKLTLGSVPAEITLKSGKVKEKYLPVLHGEMNPLLRVFIPMRDNDDSAPKFIRNYDFTFGDDNKRPKVVKDALGRKIRRI
ncbi:hypothetical protein KA016_00360 [Candidatus Saccharibacteria bacterium]|nr:hypothetical protein [Candidatus Saccharibacteria bacterium]